MPAIMARTTFRSATSAGGVALLLLACAMIFPGALAEELHSKTFRSPGFEQGPGDVSDRHFEVEMPPGHVAIRSLYSQLVDEDGVLITPSETYVHHWLLMTQCFTSNEVEVKESVLWFGLGSESTKTTVPPPYGVEIGDLGECREEKWVLRVHAIDTRGTVDVKGCTECVCRLYNVTMDQNGRPVQDDYEGGLRCCYDQTHCAVQPEFQGARRMLFLEYTVTWVEMSDEVVPVRVYVLDVRGADRKRAMDDEHYCLDVEYTVPKCSEGESKCVHTAKNVAVVPDGGDVIVAVGHQHNGGVGATLHNEDGEEICSSVPTYSKDSEEDEADYIVGMSSCYPEPGSVKVKGGEKLQLTSSYNNEDQHTGVMGIFYLLVAESQLPPRKRNFHTNLILVAVAIVATFIFIGQTISRHLKGRNRGPQYQLV